MVRILLASFCATMICCIATGAGDHRYGVSGLFPSREGATLFLEGTDPRYGTSMFFLRIEAKIPFLEKGMPLDDALQQLGLQDTAPSLVIGHARATTSEYRLSRGRKLLIRAARDTRAGGLRFEGAEIVVSD